MSTAIPECPKGHGPMALRPLANQTLEQRWSGVWYGCAPGPLGQTCMSSCLLPSAESEAQRAHMSRRTAQTQLVL